jgi:hypothetical protein
MAQQGQDAKFFQRGKIDVSSVQIPGHSLTTVQEFRAELQAAETKDKKYVKRKTVLKKIVANITMGNDSTSHASVIYLIKSDLLYSVCIIHRCCPVPGHTPP